ncbi:MAG: cell surface protein SprA [Saprospiraceae bacterium]|nr:cell surface protein SprA [Saprospiraceae bacterium]
MTKKSLLLAASVTICSVALYALAGPGGWGGRAVTIFMPREENPTAPAPAAQDTTPPLRDRYDDFLNGGDPNQIDLKDPSAIDKQVEYDPATNMYIVTEKIGEEYYRMPTYMTFDEYLNWREEQQQQQYFDRLQGVTSAGKSTSSLGDPIAQYKIGNSLIDRLFGGSTVEIKPQGQINLTFGMNYQKVQNPVLTLRQQRVTNFDFDMGININATGKVGEKLNLAFNYNSQGTFDFDNQLKIQYDPKNFSEDEILQNIEAGNVSMPLRSNLIRGVQNLFGLKTEMKFGHLRTTFVVSQQRSRQQTLSFQGGSQVQVFEKPIDEYDEFRHFFVSHWNRNQFEPAMSCLPVPQTLFTITRMEVWITNDRLLTENIRDVVALADLAEPDSCRDDFKLPMPPNLDITGKALPTNGNNELYPRILDDLSVDSSFRRTDRVIQRLNNSYGLKQIVDFEKVRARLLSPSEYSFDEQLGFISINLNVQPDQVVGVAMEYTYNGQPYKIGEFTSDVSQGDSLNQNVLFVKMLKSTTPNVQLPIWDLMMKNAYAVGAANVDPKEFRFDIFYEDPGKGQKRFLDEDDVPAQVNGIPLLQLFNLDNLNLQADPGPDGIFDFIPGLTINLRSGRVMFPVLEPFGGHLAKKLSDAGADPAVVERYVYPQLYDSTLFRAREFQQLNRFTLKGQYKSTVSSEISLGAFNLPRGSVRVTAGGRQLVEGVDYTIDYNIGRLRVLNDAILQSGQNVSVSFEDQTLFGFQNRTMLGARFDYEFSKDLVVGATYMRLFERPLTQKVNFGDDPINNRVYGLDVNLSKDAPWLTRLVDKIPLISTKAASSITAQGEVAALQPGHSKAVNLGDDKGGTVYIDDFEGSTANLPLANPANTWFISSVPQGDSVLFPESVLFDTIAQGANRAGLTWYIADPSARDGVDANNPYTRLVQYQDIFPNRQLTPLEQSNLRPLDVTFYPRERGPYNFELPDGYPGISEGLTTLGELNMPDTRWGGFMKGLNTNDFEAANIEFVEFWMLNPYMDKQDGTNISDDGDMYIDLGTISEDILRDSRQFFENAIPTEPGTGASVNTRWGRIPVLPPVVNAFDNDPARRESQDIGLDGLTDEGERNFYLEWINAIMASSLGQNAKDAIMADPSNDNFVYYLDPSYEDTDPGLLARYRYFTNTQGNSPVNNTNNLNPSATNIPDMEDLNRDNTLNEAEAYFRYRIPMRKTINPDGREVLDLTDPALAELITDTVVVRYDPNEEPMIWYRFKLPLDWQRREQLGGIQDFRSIRFIRMFWKGFTDRTTFRFATLELGRNQWRRFTQTLSCEGSLNQIPFDVNAVSIERNATRTPFNYTIPPGITREQSVGAFPDILQNEQALSLSICDLPFCDARAVFKPLNMDLRQFERIKMFVHAESVDSILFPLDSTDLSVFMRLGSDYVNNYYEYEVPLTPSDLARLMGNTNPDSREYKEEVWRPENNFDFPLELLSEVKKQRNAQADPNLGQVFEIVDPNDPRGKNKIKVVGNPNLGYVKGVMVGVRNVDTLEKQKHCVEVWINELRLNGFNERGGYAAQGRVDMKLADFGNISLAGLYTSIGWGAIDQKVIQRQLEEVFQYDLSTNLELGKFFPERTGLRIPFYAQYSNITRNPEYDPYDLDIKLKDKLDAADPADRDSIRRNAQDVTTVRGFNFTNVRKERRGSKKAPMPWDISNFSFSYAFNEMKRRTPFIINDEVDQWKGGFDYRYALGVKPIEPFKKLFPGNKHLKFINEFNFNPIPNTYGFNTVLERVQQQTIWRFAGEDPARNTYYNRRFTWDRNFDLGWDITRNLRFNYNAVSRNLIDEPLQYDENGNQVSDSERRDSIWNNILDFGRPKGFTQNVSLTWTLPFRQFYALDWISSRFSYTTGYIWAAQSLKLQNLDAGQYQQYLNSRHLGNVIQNNNVRQLNGDFNFESLYNKSKYLSKINRGTPASPPRNTTGTQPGGKPGRSDRGAPGSDDLKKEEAPANAGTGKDGTNPKDKDKSKSEKEKEKEKKNGTPSATEQVVFRTLMMVRKGRFSYSENYASIVPGFTPETAFLGMSKGFDAPGWGYALLGEQPDTDWLDNAGRKGWITQRPELNQQVNRNFTQNFDAGLSIEPFREFRIELTLNKQYGRNSTELYKDQSFNLSPDSIDFQHRAQRDFGSYTISYFSMNTLFGTDINELFARFEAYRPTISQRLGTAAGNTNPHENDGPEYAYGYGRIQQEVLLPAFIAAYTEKDPSSVQLDVFKTRPAVNWNLNYNGLSKVGKLKNIFSSISIKHGYKNTLTVNSYNTDIFYDPAVPYQIDELNFNYVARFEIPQVVINESFVPLLGIDLRTKTDLTLRLDFKKARTLAMSFIDYQLAETQSTGYTFGMGYRWKNVNIAFLTGEKGGKKSTKSKKKDPMSNIFGSGGGGNQARDLVLKFDFDLRDDITINHRLDQLDVAVPTRGQRTIAVNPSLDYSLNRRLKLRLFADYRRTVPKTSQSFPITTLNSGVQVQFSLN